jgi:hypothetical protein
MVSPLESCPSKAACPIEDGSHIESIDDAPFSLIIWRTQGKQPDAAPTVKVMGEFGDGNNTANGYAATDDLRTVPGSPAYAIIAGLVKDVVENGTQASVTPLEDGDEMFEIAAADHRIVEAVRWGLCNKADPCPGIGNDDYCPVLGAPALQEVIEEAEVL